MRADVTKEIDVGKGAQPIVIIDQDGAGFAVIEAKDSFEDGPDRGDIGLDRLGRHQLSAFIASGWIADLGRSAPHDDDRAMASLLEPAKEHHLDQMADMERRRGRVETDIAAKGRRGRHPVQPFGVRQLVKIAALVEQPQEVRFILAHESVA